MSPNGQNVKSFFNNFDKKIAYSGGYVSRFQAALPGGILLPIPYKEKGPRIPAWQKIAYEDTLSVSYRWELQQKERQGGNIGVLLGPPSDDIVTFDIDDPQLIEMYLERYPWAEKSIITKARG
jgi:hypothetical protein